MQLSGKNNFLSTKPFTKKKSASIIISFFPFSFGPRFLPFRFPICMAASAPTVSDRSQTPLQDSLQQTSFLKRDSCSQSLAWSSKTWKLVSNLATNLHPAGGFFSTMKVRMGPMVALRTETTLCPTSGSIC